MSTPQYLPPPYPPPGVQAHLLRPNTAPPYSIDLDALASRGWITLPIEPSPEDPLYSTFSELFSSSSQFFDLPQDSKSRYHIPVQKSSQASEEGYLCIPGEKSMITLRKAATTPEEFELKAKAAAAWRAGSTVMRGVLAAIEESLDMRSGVLQRTMGPAGEMPGEGARNVATLLRMFRYERPQPADADTALPPPKVVAEAHKDLGLLSLVVGHTPGLECWDPAAHAWAACEEGAQRALTVTLLVGQTLAKFTNWRYSAGRHRVFVHPLAGPPRAEGAPLLADPAYRFSLVHALRAHLPLRVSSAEFETRVTGACAPALQFADVPITEIYRAIGDAHWNVNIAVEERRRQERELHRMTGAADARPVIPTDVLDGGEGSSAPARQAISVSGFRDLFNSKRSSRQTAVS